MKDIEDIEDWYRDELNNYNVEPDKNGWDSLAEDLDTSTPITDENISEWYKKEVSKLEERPDFTVWEKLSTKLDTTSVWDKLTVSLDRYELFLWWRNMAFRGTAILLLLLGSVLTYNNYNNDDDVLSENDNTNLIKDHNYGSASWSGAEANSKNNSNELYTHTNPAKDNKKNTTKRVSQSTQNQNTNSPTQQNIDRSINVAKGDIIKSSSESNGDKTLYASIKEVRHYNSISVENLNALKNNLERNIYTASNLNGITEKDILQPYLSSEFLVKKDKNKILFNKKRFSSHSSYRIQTKRLYIGANMGLKKQGMITKLKENSPLNNYKQNELLDFGTNFGGVVGVVISSKFNIETNVKFNSTAGYKRSYSAEGIAFQENLNMNYTSISLLAKKMSSRSTFDNRIYSTNIFGGAYASYLRTATSDINGISRNLEEYNKTDIGIVLGIEQDRYITKTIVITPGIRYNQGLFNVANENSSFESSRNFSFEFNLGIKYIFIKSGR